MVLHYPVILTQGMLLKGLVGLRRMIFFCKKMGLAIKGREMELLSFLASLEANRNEK